MKDDVVYHNFGVDVSSYADRYIDEISRFLFRYGLYIAASGRNEFYIHERAMILGKLTMQQVGQSWTLNIKIETNSHGASIWTNTWSKENVDAGTIGLILRETEDFLCHCYSHRLFANGDRP